jgi:hypothetical protein
MAEYQNIKYFLKLFDDADTDGKDQIDKNKFTELYRQIEADNNKTEEEAQIVFDGIDIDNNQFCSREEFDAMVKAILGGDEVYLLKMIFRSFDKDRSRSLDKKEISRYSKFIGQEKSETEIEQFVQEKGKDGKVNFYQLVKYLKGKDIPKDTDPYNGKIPLTSEPASKTKDS